MCFCPSHTIHDVSLSFQETQSPQKDSSKKSKRKGKAFFPKFKEGLMKWVLLRRIEKGNVKTNSNSHDRGGAIGT